MGPFKAKPTPDQVFADMVEQKFQQFRRDYRAIRERPGLYTWLLGGYQEGLAAGTAARRLMSNCHNCGAPHEPVRCSYCGTGRE